MASPRPGAGATMRPRCAGRDGHSSHDGAEMSKIREFLRTANRLGGTWAEMVRIFWRLTRNVRVRVGLGRYDPERVLPLDTRVGRAPLRDNFGDVTNLHGLWVENVYGVETLAEDGAVVDVGANIGLFAHWIAHHNPDRRIVCVEPLPTNVRMIPLNCPGAEVVACGLGTEPSQVELTVDDHGMMASRMEQSWHTQPIVIDVKPLDAIADELGLGEIALLKIDTEGMELEVLDGGPATLGRTRRVVMETHGTELHRASMERLGAAGLRIYHEHFDGHTGFVLAAR